MGIVDAVFPVKCVGCKACGKYICQECYMSVRRSSRPIERSSGEMTRVYATYQYGGVVQKLLKKVKYKSSWKMVDELAERWSERVSDAMLDEVSECEVVVTSVPMYKLCQRERGFNQAERLGRKLADELGVEYIETMRRTRATKPMYGLDKKARRGNVKGAFEMREKMSAELVILVDDVWTTGSTMRECAKMLRKMGIEEIWGVVVAR